MHFFMFLLLFLSLTVYNSYSKQESNVGAINSSLFLDFNQSKGNDIKFQALPKSKFFTVKNEKANSIFNEIANNIILNDFPITDNKTSNLVLTRNKSITDQNTKWLRGTKNGIIRQAAPIISTFSGIIENQPDSKVFVSVANGFLYASIQDEQKNLYNIAPLNSNANTQNSSSQHRIYSVHDDFQNSGTNMYSCETEEPEYHRYEFEDNFKSEKLQANGLLEVSVGVEAAYDFYKLHNEDYNKAAGYIASVMAQVSKLYEDNINVTFYIPTVLIWDNSSDNYVGTVNLAEKLQTMPSIWSGDITDWDLMVLFADIRNQPPGTIVAGIAYSGQPGFGVLCEREISYAVFGINGYYTYPNFNYTSDVAVAAHELGHNFSSPHTHSCYFQPNMIDTCITAYIPYQSDGCVRSGNPIPSPGTIMSYCHLTNSTHSVELYFHPRNKVVMRRAAEEAAKVNCLSTPVEPTVRLLSFLGTELYQGGSEQKIRWTSSRVQNITIKYSTDYGTNWNTIAQALPATDSIYKWIIPNIYSDKVLMLIHDAGNESVADTSLTRFTMANPSITLNTLFTDEKFGHLSNIRVMWKKILVNKVMVQFSTNGGETWQTLRAGLTSDEYMFNTPDIESGNCQIRVVDESNNEVVAYSGKFSIGKETATIVYPKQSDRICSNSKVDIRWTSDFCKTIFILYSIDNGENWKKIKIAALDASLGLLNWNVPNIKSESAMLKIVLNEEVEKILDITQGNFEIDSCEAGIFDLSNPIDNRFAISEIIPNPNDGTFSISIENKMDLGADFEFLLVDELGRVVANLPNYYLQVGSSKISFSLSSISSGNYFIVAKYSNHFNLKAIQIVK